MCPHSFLFNGQKVFEAILKVDIILLNALSVLFVSADNAVQDFSWTGGLKKHFCRYGVPIDLGIESYFFFFFLVFWLLFQFVLVHQSLFDLLFLILFSLALLRPV